MRDMMRNLFREASSHAMDVTVIEDGVERKAKAFIGLCDHPSSRDLGSHTPMGVDDNRRYYIITDRSAYGFESRSVEIHCGDRVYELLRRDPIWCGDHVEGIMRLKGGGEDVC